MGRSRRIPLLLLVALAGCGDDPTGPGTVDIDGVWSGMIEERTLTISLAETDGTVSGSGEYETASATFPFDVTGTRHGAELTLELTWHGPYTPALCICDIEDRARITGKLLGSGFRHDVALTREEASG